MVVPSSGAAMWVDTSVDHEEPISMEEELLTSAAAAVQYHWTASRSTKLALVDLLAQLDVNRANRNVASRRTR